MMIRIYGKFPSLNEYVDACRTNPHAGAKMKKEVEQIIALQIVRMKPITEPVIVHFLWHEKNRRRDKDNVAFAKKFVLDAMQKSGKLPNDNNRYIAGFTDLFEYGSDYGVSVEVEVVKDETRRDTGEPE